MILPDLNLLLYSYNKTSPFHSEAKHWWESVMTEGKLIGISWSIILGFLRITTLRNIFNNPLSVKQAMKIVNSWLELPNVEILYPSPKHLLILEQLLENSFATGNLISDAHLAALAIENNATIYSNDNDFKRFEGIRFTNPLAPK